jgi:hypothetical protein
MAIYVAPDDFIYARRLAIPAFPALFLTQPKSPLLAKADFKM